MTAAPADAPSAPVSASAPAPDFTVLIPARLASSRLPNKPLADIAGLPMVVRVARQAALSGAQRVVVATDDETIVAACEQHAVDCLLTRRDHASGSDRLAEACIALGLDGDHIVVNVQGDEPLIDPALIRQCAVQLDRHPDCAAATIAHEIETLNEFTNPNVVKLVLDAEQRAVCFSRAPLPWPRDGSTVLQPVLPEPKPLRHVGLYAYRAAYLRRFPLLPAARWEQTEQLEQLRMLWHGDRISVHVTAHAPAAGVDTPEDLARVRALLVPPVR